MDLGLARTHSLSLSLSNTHTNSHTYKHAYTHIHILGETLRTPSTAVQFSSMLCHLHRDFKDYRGRGAQDGRLDFHTAAELCVTQRSVSLYVHRDGYHTDYNGPPDIHTMTALLCSRAKNSAVQKRSTSEHSDKLISLLTLQRRGFGGGGVWWGGGGELGVLKLIFSFTNSKYTSTEACLPHINCALLTTYLRRRRSKPIKHHRQGKQKQTWGQLPRAIN